MTTTARDRDDRDDKTGPGHSPARRPPVGLRVFVGVLAVGAVVFNVALMLSDRAPGLSKRVFGDFALRLSNRLDAPRRVDEVTDGRTPGSDAIVHIGVWAVAVTLIGLAIWRWSGLIVAALATFAASVFIETGQGRYSDTRAVEMSDVLANAVGVALGTMLCVGCYLVWSAVSGLISAARRPTR